MSNNPRPRVLTSRNSPVNRRGECFNPGVHYNCVSDSNDNIVYIHQPTATNKNKECHANLVSAELQRKNCVKRLCAGICNFFRFKSTAVGYTEELRYPSPVPGSKLRGGLALPLQSSSTTLEIPMPCNSLMNYTGWENEEAIHSDDGEYIIYVPRMSRAKLQAKFVDPLRQANFDPVIIHPLCRQCFGCHSCELNMNRAPENSLRTHTRESSDPGIPWPRKKTRFATSCRTSMENIPQERTTTPKAETTIQNKKGGGDGDATEKCLPNDQDQPSLQEYVDEKTGDSKNIQFLYVPGISGGTPVQSKRKRQAFKPSEKNLSRDAMQERHKTVARNRELLALEKKARLESHFSVWSRRTKIGKMKKKLASETKSLALTPPNMLESRFHHIHSLGRCDNQNNSVGRYFDKEENNVVALKIFSDKPFETTTENLDNKLMAIQEIKSLNRLNHKNIVKLLGYFELHDKFHLILESCDHSLREEIQKHPSGVGTSVSKKMIKQALNGLHFCHQANCLHRDLCPENILVCKSGAVKIADFDRSVILTDSGVGTTSPTPGSFVYNSPEILAGDKKYGLPSDVWSLGVIFCELLVGKPPWSGKSAQAQLREIHNSVGPLLTRHASIAKLQTEDKGNKSYAVNNHAQLQQMFTTISNSSQSFIMKCLDVNPLCRFTCGELLHHHFIKGK